MKAETVMRGLLGSMLSVLALPASALTAVEVAKLTVSDDLDGFGYSVAMDGDTAIIGAPRALDDLGNAYVFFDRDATGEWVQQAEFRRGSLNFGFSVDIDGDTAIVGNFEEDLNAFQDRVQIFFRDSFGDWHAQAELVASDPVIGDAFGFSVAIDGDTAVVGTRPEASTGFAPIPGAAYVFVRDDAGNWSEQAKLLASDGEIGDTFGKSVDVQDDTAIIGRHKNDIDSTETTVRSAVYIYTRDPSGNWSEQTKLLARTRTNFDGEFGLPREVAIDGNLIVMAAGNDLDSNGLVYVFEHDPVIGWSEVAELKSGVSGDSFGSSVAVVGDRLVIGAASDDENGAGSGSAYVFTPGTSGQWDERTKLIAGDGSNGDVFGTAVAANEDTVIIGAPGGASNNFQRGAAYVFQLIDSLQVDIDIKPHVERNVVNVNSQGTIRVAVLSDITLPFDPLQIDISSVAFGPDGARAIRHKTKDLNRDGISDLIFRFNIAETGISAGGRELSLRGETFDGQAISGTDSIKIVSR